MKKITLLLFMFIGLGTYAQTITHSTSLELGDENVACNIEQNTSSDNRYFRFFRLSDFGITGNWGVDNVQFGLQSIVIPTLPAGFPITVKLYTTTATNFPTAYPTGYTELAQVTTSFLTTDAETLVTVEFDTTVPAGSNLLVEVGYVAQVEGSLNRIFLSANALGQSASTFISSTGCAIVPPTPLESINFPNAHLILAVTGTTLSISDNALDKVSVYPNPTKGNVSIDLPATIGIESATITDITGKQMAVKIGANNSFSIAEYRTGVYILNIQTSEGVINKRIIKE